MKIAVSDASQERRILIGMITDPLVLGRIAARWGKDSAHFASRWSNLVGSWCVDYQRRYDRPPGKDIEGLFQTWASVDKDKDTIALVERFLSSLSSEYETLAMESNTAYLLDTAAAHFNGVRLAELAEYLQSGVTGNGELDKAIAKVQDFHRVDMGAAAGIDVLQDEDAILRLFADKREALVKYPGAAGEFFGDVLSRDGFVAFQGREKIGKSWCLLDLAWRAMEQRRKVAFFETGDLSEGQVMARFMARAARHPMKAGKVLWPTAITRDGAVIAHVEYEELEFDRPLNRRKAMEACQRVMHHKVKSIKSYLRLSVHATATLSVPDIEAILQQWERDGYSSDIIVVDYSDLLAPCSGGSEPREQINSNWKALSALRIKRHCLVVTATQVKAGAYHKDRLHIGDFADDKRKISHVTGMIGINATDDEASRGIRRLNWIELRDSAKRPDLHMATCLPLANTCVCSTF